MDTNSNLFNTGPEELILRIKAEDSEAAKRMGLLCLSGLGVKQNLEQAGLYFAKAKQLGAKNVDAFIAYVHECNDRMAKAVDSYVGRTPIKKKEAPITPSIDQRFEKVRAEREKMLKLLSEYGLPECPMNTSLGSLLEDLESGQRSLTSICSIISLSDVSEQWFYDTAWLLYEEGDVDLASMWLKKCHLDSEDVLLKKIQEKSDSFTTDDIVPIDVKNGSILEKKLNIRILPDSLFTSGDIFKKALEEWSRECNNKKLSYDKEQRRIEEERQRKIEEERCKTDEARKRKEAEARKKAEDEKRRAEEEARKRAEERTFIVGRYGRQRDEILDKTVSRQHCRVTLLDEGMVEIENLSNSNGTVVNGEKIQKVKVSMDSDLKMGNYIVKVRDLFPPRKSPTVPDKQTTA